MLLLNDPMSLIKINFFMPIDEEDENIAFMRHEYLRHATGTKSNISGTKIEVKKAKVIINRTNEILQFLDKL